MSVARSLLFALLAASQTGCLTAQLLGDRYYSERIRAYLVSEDRAFSVALGEQYTYVFELDDTIKATLASQHRDQAEIRIPTLAVEPDGSATASYTILLTNPSPAVRTAALRAGYKADGTTRLFKSGGLRGTRYRTFDLPPNATAEVLRSPLLVPVAEVRPDGQRVVAAAVSPLTMTADGGLLLFGAPLYIARILSAQRQ